MGKVNQNSGISYSKIKGSKVKSIKLRFLIILLLVTIIIISAFANIFNNKTEAATADTYDVILFFGQSNMQGSATAAAETRHLSSKSEFAAKTGI